MSKREERVIIIPVFFYILTEFKDYQKTTITKIQKKTSVTYSYLQKVVKCFIEKNWVVGTRDGRIVEFTITDEGKKVRDIISQLFLMLEINENNIHLYKFRNEQKHKYKILKREK